MAYLWRRDLRRESNLKGSHRFKTQEALKLGIMFFIFSEVILFFRIFWGFFHYSLNPVGEVGFVWPPTSIVRISPYGVPLYNTIILVSSGLTATLAHHLILLEDRRSIIWLGLSIVLGAYFTSLQLMEYYEARFTIMHGNYGGVFFLGTGFHGAHVCVGTCLLLICLFKLYGNHYRLTHHVRFELSAWYWHFVDVVWLFLFVTVYWWAS